jgi:hypothetical protein
MARSGESSQVTPQIGEIPAKVYVRINGPKPKGNIGLEDCQVLALEEAKTKVMAFANGMIKSDLASQSERVRRERSRQSAKKKAAVEPKSDSKTHDVRKLEIAIIPSEIVPRIVDGQGKVVAELDRNSPALPA